MTLPKRRTILSCTALALFTSYLGFSAQSSACDCLFEELPKQYALSDNVMLGEVLFSFHMRNSTLFFTRVNQSFKGCTSTNEYVWLQSASDASSCGTDFRVGEPYLLHTSGGDGSFRFAHRTNSCSGNRLASNLSTQDWDYLNTREVCCDGTCTCVGSEAVECEDLCDQAEPCPDQGATSCQVNRCGTCNAEFFNDQGEPVCLPPATPRCRSDQDCEASQYCDFSGECKDDSTCNFDGECNLAGNRYPATSTDCEGYGECSQNTCQFVCGDPKCVNHEGFDYGPCDVSIGWVVEGDACVNVTSACGHLVPNNLGFSVFETQADCENTCQVERPGPRDR